MEAKVRDSNYELLRVISMFMIVMWHILVHGHLLSNTTGLMYIGLRFIQAILVVHVCSFILVTGYYQSESSFKFKKLVSLNNAAWFYRIVIAIIFVVYNLATIGRVEFIKNIMPIDFGFYWFIDIYLLLYAISPFLNMLIQRLDKKTYIKLLLTFFIVASIIPTFTMQQAYNDSYGYSLINFIFLYFIGGYLRKYKLEIWDYFKIKSPQIKRLVYISIFCLLFITNFALSTLGNNLLGLGHIAQVIGRTLSGATYCYDNPLVILGAVMYFLYFGCLTFKSKFINKLGSLVFGVYLIHDNPYVRNSLYQLFDFKEGLAITSYRVFPKIFIVALIIFAGCLIIEWVRQLLFYLFSKLWISKTIKNKWYNYVNKLKNT